MKIFTSALLTETNTFSHFETTVASFEETGILRGAIDAGALGSVGQVVEQWRTLAARHGDHLSEGLYAIAQPAGPVLSADYASLRAELLAGVRAAGPLDVVLLYLHGAMVAQNEDDCEGDLIQAVRAIVGPRCRIGVELDPHCHLSQAMTQGADAIVLMREYPHVDYAERAAELFTLCRDAAAGATRPAMAVVDCRLVGFYPTTSQPMRGLVDRLAEVERRPGILSASLVHGFPWGDVADAGSKVLVIADGDPDLARRTAEELARAFYRLRAELVPRLEIMDDALRDLPEGGPPRILADAGDNPGGGAPCDHTVMLSALLARTTLRSAFGMLWDPEAVRACMSAGVGASLRLRVGGKAGPTSALPLDLDVTVRGLSEHHTQEVGRIIDPLGAAAWVRSGPVDIVLISRRQQTLSPTGFTNLGVPLQEARVIGVKSSHHYHAEFSKLSGDCRIIETGAALSMDFARLPYRKRDLNFFPAVDDPAPHLS
ncbi:M81 family metallopeptidase [Mitsuaria sp. GD03876]|uniref:M81 family metallopeptidase n=1 Tax=Mitsuaria sp. GD03876 TaxID=2975399 RepID=UPI002448CB09|nr:M81 family metallopeptidase [Mitsuaria sp. GD03876]MDH0864722.1 M81 family metallopeptidase [Mitsuaria sp. GD03876]